MMPEAREKNLASKLPRYRVQFGRPGKVCQHVSADTHYHYFSSTAGTNHSRNLAT